MAAYTTFEQFTLDLGAKVHDLQASGDTLKVYLAASVPDAATHTVKTDLPGIVEEYGYLPGDIQNDYSLIEGVATLTGEDVTFTANGGAFGPFRYAVLYNSSTTVKVNPLIAYWDYGEDFIISHNNQYIVNFGAAIFTLS